MTYMPDAAGVPERETVEAEMFSEGHNFVIFSRMSGAQPRPFLRINAALVVRVQEDG